MADCKTCDDSGIDELGGYRFPCPDCEAGQRQAVKEQQAALRYHEAQASKLRRQLREGGHL